METQKSTTANVRPTVTPGKLNEACLRLEALKQTSKAYLIQLIGNENVRRITYTGDEQKNQIGWESAAIQGATTMNEVAIWHPDELAVAAERNPKEIHIVWDQNRERVLARIPYDKFMKEVDDKINDWKDGLTPEYQNCLQ